ncbi:DgyrCDS4352 [Dimorphilus gyrociliatus]|uniref:DgyrCDS4352 n=1 Tax=Dimorphilus gyrociliatus TaxID=2664684 RepID=A0A7I8VGS0_9ANNE|nr:DgyrCDS4352 [Dimorphilus gyrociliatus]
MTETASHQLEVAQSIPNNATGETNFQTSGAKTSDFYRTKEIPARFEHPGNFNFLSQTGKCYLSGNPVFSCTLPVESEQTPHSSDDDWFRGYESKTVNPMYRTTNSSYGSNPPNVHTMPTTFRAKSQKFSKHLGQCGMYKNHSLNTSMDKSNVPEY